MAKVIYVGYDQTVIIAISISAPVCLITLAVMLFICLRDRRLSNLHKSLVESDLEFGDTKMPESIQDIMDYNQTYTGKLEAIYMIPVTGVKWSIKWFRGIEMSHSLRFEENI